MSKLICPNCGAHTSFNPILANVKGILVDLSSKVATNYTNVRVAFEEPYQYGVDNYAILNCQACGKRFIAHNSEYSPEGAWQVVYPICNKVIAEEIPEPIKSELSEAELCYATGAYRACTAMCQITLEALWHQCKVANLNELETAGIISQALRQQADEIRLWGNIAKHDVITDVVSEEDAKQLLAYLEAILNAVYVEPARLGRLKEKREQLDQS